MFDLSDLLVCLISVTALYVFIFASAVHLDVITFTKRTPQQPEPTYSGHPSLIESRCRSCEIEALNRMVGK